MPAQRENREECLGDTEVSPALLVIWESVSSQH